MLKVLEKNITIKQAVLEKLGEVYPVAQLGDMRLPFFDVDIVNWMANIPSNGLRGEGRRDGSCQPILAILRFG